MESADNFIDSTTSTKLTEFIFISSFSSFWERAQFGWQQVTSIVVFVRLAFYLSAFKCNSSWKNLLISIFYANIRSKSFNSSKVYKINICTAQRCLHLLLPTYVPTKELHTYDFYDNWNNMSLHLLLPNKELPGLRMTLALITFIG